MESRDFRSLSAQWLSSLSDQSRTTLPEVVSTTQSVLSPSTTRSAVETIASVRGNETVYITVTHAQPTSSERAGINGTIAQSTQQEGSSNLAGPIAGGVVGGVALISSAFFLLCLARRKKRAKERKRATLPPQYASEDPSEELGSGLLHTITQGATKLNVTQLLPPQAMGLHLSTRRQGSTVIKGIETLYHSWIAQ